ncbi:unnamed protein product [Discosporangium mesarthrocarpum]
MTSIIELSPPRTVHVAGGATLRVTASGTLNCITTDNRGKDIDITINSVLIAPGLGRHLFSSSAGRLRGVTTILSSHPRLVVAKTIIPIRGDSNLFFLDACVESTTTSSTIEINHAQADASLWHRRLGHINSRNMGILQKLDGSGVNYDSSHQLNPARSACSARAVSRIIPRQHKPRARSDLNWCTRIFKGL